MSIDYIVASLPALKWGEKAPISWEKFCETAGGGFIETALPECVNIPGCVDVPQWMDLETQLKNAMAEARGGAKYVRPTSGCALYWKKRVIDCFAEKDVLKRDEMLDRVWWDAAGELTPPSEPLGKGALATYAVRLKVALKRTKISTAKGNEAFDRLTAETNLSKK